jgi:magnesium-transporting ATPase (P-type)
LILINSNLEKGICFVETKGLDGETNLKAKTSRPEMIRFAADEEGLFKNFTESKIVCDMPNP